MILIRKIILRCLFSWWLIPSFWLTIWPIAFLISGHKEATYICCALTHITWNPEE
jgi:hypothetical protein